MDILLVEDNPTDALLVEAALEDAHLLEARIAHATTLAEAFLLLSERSFNAVLVDLNLPDGAGLSNFERLREVAPDAPMIVLTGLNDEALAVEAIRRGAADYLLKNEFEGSHLERSIRYALERKRFEDGQLELTRAQIERAEAEAANRAKDQFLATISHELRTPLNAVLGWASLLRSNDLDEPTTEQALEIIERNARLQAQLIEDLLDVSRIVAGNFRLEMADVELSALVRAAVETLNPEANQKEIALECEMQTLPMCGDAMRLQQVAWNLIANAFKFTPNGGTVTLRTFDDGQNNAILEVQDTGQGIAPEFLPLVFDRFRQADAAHTRRHGGLGLGLSIVRHIVELHGGSVSVDSPGKDQGTTFTVRLPIRPLQEACSHESDGASARNDGAGSRAQISAIASDGVARDGVAQDGASLDVDFLRTSIN